LPIAPSTAASAPASTTPRKAAISHSPPWKPSVDSSSAPTKKPSPFTAFFDPVSKLTHWYSAPWASFGTTSLIELFELILVRSLAMPDTPCTTST
jgi:hypothetical protein